jgi:hypothetical protein
LQVLDQSPGMAPTKAHLPLDVTDAAPKIAFDAQQVSEMPSSRGDLGVGQIAMAHFRPSQAM